MYSHGEGVPQDYAEAGRWYRKAAEEGNAAAEYGLGEMYFYGEGVQQDRAQARRLFRKAAERGDEYARNALGLRLTGFRRVFLFIQFIGGILLTFHFLSLNSFEPNTRLRDSRAKVITGTGVLCVFTAGLSWYGYTHSMMWCWIYGFNLFTLFEWLLDGVLFVLLVRILKPRKGIEPANGADSRLLSTLR
jgi:hypothetical protein